MFNKLKEHLKVMFEGNRCRFRKGCKYYRLDSAICNNLLKRFPDDDRSYCGTYRWFDSGWYPIHPEFEKSRITLDAESISAGKIDVDSITIAKKGEKRCER